ncbi:hypothetical protein DBY68_016675 [Pseudocitrobacter sp. RIT415]|uniref:colicin immunity protein Cui n=1 Tax=Pseudocitrobacter sp. RIT415 TaxID=2202163 RepID=UPI000D38B688|nr:colicin immunity protein Cui [Pseudocitrobacter sp. RIT 415]RAU45255.1 hypothetical protein DBY68_016675 [Pseudocitrobacter sp. RIT 415]
MEKNKGVLKYPALFYLAGIVPIALIFLINATLPNSALIQSLYSISIGHVRSYSEQFLQVSSIASAYTKTAPLFVFILYVLCWRKIRLSPVDLDVAKWWKLLPLLILLIIAIFALTYIGEQNMTTTSKKIIRLASGNQTFLFVYYIGMFGVNYFFTWLMAFYIQVYAEFKNKTGSIK